jgi:photosystem II stability/assembly factor-like uncharacterized protein
MMRIRSGLLLVAVLLTGTTVWARGIDHPQKGTTSPRVADHMLIVKFRPHVPFVTGAALTGASGVDRVLARIRATRVSPLHDLPALRKAGARTAAEDALARMVTIVYGDDVAPSVLAREIALDPDVEYAEPYYIFEPLYMPNDPQTAQQWAISAIKLDQAWDVTKGDSTIVIGYIDTGVNYNHEDLSGAIWINRGEWGTNGEKRNNGIDDDQNGKVDDWHGWDIVGTGTAQAPVPDNDPMDLAGHGTAGAGMAAAVADNGIGMAGAGFRVKLWPIKAQNDAGNSGILGYNALAYAADMGCKVINCSWGANGFISQAMQDVIDYAYQKGCVVVAGAGNSVIDNDVNPFLPSALNHVLGVSSIERGGGFSTWAAYGACVSINAPGTEVLGPTLGGGYSLNTGTSFSTPLMSGLAALVFSVHPTWTPAQVMAQIRATSDAFVTPRDPKHYGRANAYAAVTMNASMNDIPGVILDSYTFTTPGGAFFTEGGQTATLDFNLRNALAPLSANATAEVILDASGLLSTTTPQIPIGAVATNGVKSISVQVKLIDKPLQSEGYIPVILKITDGAYTDYVVARATLFLDRALHTALDINWPYNSVHPVTRDIVWACGDYAPTGGTQQDLVFRSTDGGGSWYYAFGTGWPTGKGVYCIRGIDDRIALVGTGPADGTAEIYRTSDGGTNWTGTSVSSLTPFVNFIHMFDASSGIMMGDPKNSKWGLGKTTDGGKTWSAITPTVPSTGTEAGWNNGYDFVGDIGWFGTNNSKLFKTTDRGATWTSYAMPSKNATNITFKDKNTGIARFSSQNGQGTDTLALTTDGGSTWKILTSIDAPDGSVVFERFGTRLWYFQAYSGFVSSDLGFSWTAVAVPPDMSFVSCTASWSDAFDTFVWAGGINVYRLQDVSQIQTAADDPQAAPGGFRIASVSPNPAGPQGDAVVQFEMRTSQRVQLAVYDIAGRLVRSLFSATLAPGSHTTRIGAETLPAGTYMVRLTSETQQAASKLVVVR